MPVPSSSLHESLKSSRVVSLHHGALETTFCGLEHPLSTPQSRVHQYRGIKYASIPARFRQSRLCTVHPPVTDASRFGPICPQIHAAKSMEETLFGIPQAQIPVPDLKQDEFECLNLNVTCPAGLNPLSRIPVMLWVHGGGDKGSGSEWYSDPGALVQKSMSYRKPIIVVSFNFRLGLLGFATNPVIRDDNKLAGEEGTGNYGLRDQRKAQEWVHRFINEFGGDPANITLFGSGSGGADIICHLLSRANQTQPMFHRAIVQSAVFEPTLPDVSSAGWHLSRVMSALQVSSIEKFRLVPTAKLLGLGHTIRAVDDGVFFRDGWQAYFRSESAHSHHHHLEPTKPLGRSSFLRASEGSSKSRSRSRSAMNALLSPTRTTTFKGDSSMQPLIIGDCSSDSLLWSMPLSLWTSAGVVRRLKAICQSLSKTHAILRVYDINSFTPDDEIMDHVLELVNDARVAWPTQCVADNAKRERGGKGVWRFVFDQEGPTRCLPHHAADLMYLFDNIRLPEKASAAADMDLYFEGPYESDDEDEDMHCPSAGNSHPGNVGVGEYIFSSDSLVAKCESLTRGRQGNGNVGYAHAQQDDDEWLTTAVDEYSYARVRDAIQERWISFAHGEAPWREDKVFVFGPEGETGERSMEIFDGRRRKRMWREALEPLGFTLVQKLGVELSRGPALGADRMRI